MNAASIMPIFRYYRRSFRSAFRASSFSSSTYALCWRSGKEKRRLRQGERRTPKLIGNHSKQSFSNTRCHSKYTEESGMSRLGVFCRLFFSVRLCVSRAVHRFEDSQKETIFTRFAFKSEYRLAGERPASYGDSFILQPTVEQKSTSKSHFDELSSYYS